MSWSSAHEKTGQRELKSRQPAGENPHLDPARPGAISGFTLVELMIVVGVIALLVALALPSFAKSRHQTRVRVCINNLNQIDRSKQIWALENRKSDNDTPTTDQVAVYIKNSKWPHCPESGSYRARRISRDPSCTKSSIGHALTNENGDDDPSAD